MNALSSFKLNIKKVLFLLKQYSDAHAKFKKILIILLIPLPSLKFRLANVVADKKVPLDTKLANLSPRAYQLYQTLRD